jgi:hypothetical protein
MARCDLGYDKDGYASDVPPGDVFLRGTSTFDPVERK